MQKSPDSDEVNELMERISKSKGVKEIKSINGLN
jgi:hypothetical protein